ncbi:hypothetical protein ARMGADRAFT_1107120 [Armillaria gallica]|uniref:Metallo-beta-lactamase domain-containing protein n=1 Tax=Armillaria gallica TaxID=47427 RepID=A0A2H3DUQ3_ARMGA|nr:hypothetical protein ARMGADRAFT_1107120 [Armillaria gallica]
MKGNIMFDLGMRMDQEKYAPVVQGFFNLFRELGRYDMGSDEGEMVSEQLVKGGVYSICTLPNSNFAYSLTHFNYISDISIFPSTTELVIGPGMDLQTYPEHEDAYLIESDTMLWPKVTELSFSNAMLHIMDLPALDYFGDRSFYVLDTPSHHPGHISSLTHVMPIIFVLLKGDCCYHVGDIHPSPPPFSLHLPCIIPSECNALPLHILLRQNQVRAPTKDPSTTRTLSV